MALPNDTGALASSYYISQVKVGSGEYYIKDAWARNAIGQLEGVQGVMRLVGTTTDDLFDGYITPTVTLLGDPTPINYEAQHGDVVILGQSNNRAEFVWIKTTPTSETNEGHWELLGDEDAWVKKGSSYNVSFVPTTSSPTGSTTYTPAGTIKNPTFTTPTITVTGTYSKATGWSGSLTTTDAVVTSTGTYTPAGSVAIPEIIIHSPTLNATNTVITSTGTYTPTGTITIKVDNNTANAIKSLTTASVYVNSSEQLILPSIVVTGGTTGTITGAFNGNSATITVTGTYNMVTSVEAPTWDWSTITPASVPGSFVGTSATITVTGTYVKATGVSGSITNTDTSVTSTGTDDKFSGATFSGTAATITITSNAQYISAIVGTVTLGTTPNPDTIPD